MKRLESLWSDFRGAVRVLTKSPGPSVLVILSIALGVGLTTGLFSAGDALLLRSFPIHQPDRLLKATSNGDDGRPVPYGWPDYLEMAEAATEFGTVVGYQRRATVLKLPEQNEMEMTHIVTSNYFSTLGVHAALGQASLDPVAGRPAVVVGHRLWQRRLGGDLAAIGKTIILNGRPFVVAGVMPSEFNGLMSRVVTDVWMGTGGWFDSLENAHERLARNGDFEIFIRLNPGADPRAAAFRMDTAIRGPGKHKPAPRELAGTILTQPFALTWTEAIAIGGGLIAGLALILFVACANAVQLRLAQSENRRKEFALRLALGGGAWRIARQVLVETALLCVAGAALGLLIAQAVIEQIDRFFSMGRAFIDLGIRLDHRAAAFTLGALTLSVLLTALAPIRHSLRLDLSEALKAAQGVVGLRRPWQQRFLVSAQLAVSVALLGLTVLFLTSLWNVTRIRPGLDPDKPMLFVEVLNNLGPRWRESIAGWCEQACERLAALPGVRGATFARRVPLSGSGGGATVRLETPGRAPLAVRYNNVGGNYFRLTGTRVLAGRGIEPEDRFGSEAVIVVSRAMGANTGESLRLDGGLWRVVGIAEDAPSNDLRDRPEPFVYFPFAQMPSGDVTLLVETAGEPQAIERAVRAELKRFDPRIEMGDATSLQHLLDSELAGDRTMAALAMGSGIFVVLLTAAGLFGLLQYTVSRRTREIGLRLALGARTADVRRMVLLDSLRLAAWGIPAGVVLLAVGGWVVRATLLGITYLHPLTYSVAVAATVLVALAAGWWPARRASRVDPMAALRAE